MSEVSEERIKRWDFLCRELAKANVTIRAMNRLWGHINMHHDAYNPAFQLLLDALTTKTILYVRHMFDNQDDALRLTSIGLDKEQLAKAQTLKAEAEELLTQANKRHAHISKKAGETNFESNFMFLTENGISNTLDLVNQIRDLLSQWGRENNCSLLYTDDWPNIDSSIQVLFENLEEYEFIRSNMSTFEHVEMREKMKKAKDESSISTARR